MASQAKGGGMLLTEALPRNQQLLPSCYRLAMKAGEQDQNFTLVQLSIEDDRDPFLGRQKF